MLLIDLMTTMPSSDCVRQPALAPPAFALDIDPDFGKAIATRSQEGAPNALVSLPGAVLRRRLSRQLGAALHQRRLRASVSEPVCVAARTRHVGAHRQRALGRLQPDRRPHPLPRRPLRFETSRSL